MFVHVDMKKDVFYRIDGSTGAHVAKQLKKGDKIRICRNGSLVLEDPESISPRFTSRSFATEYVMLIFYQELLNLNLQNEIQGLVVIVFILM